MSATFDDDPPTSNADPIAFDLDGASSTDWDNSPMRCHKIFIIIN